ncbi:hypothetical protein U0C82_03705 [Fulvimarina sp. 2208YS6-2-32]|uniref:Phage tail tube protein n=1 Tax=Fulvimarina uroteuthidis TaxID=3098149 RepID=A0ABU5HYR7_9HYPH|nr:hypothetical protein [Fulvimarina sp. 2208YS6-2-32]MDY8108254.1 hypothetical protein [Fulvimarina sp. 2208YS6-2-32]
MANNPLPVASAKFSIGGITADYTEVALAADTYIQVKGVRTMPGFGDTFQDITVEEVDDPRTRHAKGTANGVTMELVCSRRSDDPGQQAMVAAAETRSSYNVKVEIPTETGTFDTYYTSVLVMSANTGLGGPNDTQMITFSMQPQEAPIEVLAA